MGVAVIAGLIVLFICGMVAEKKAKIRELAACINNRSGLKDPQAFWINCFRDALEDRSFFIIENPIEVAVKLANAALKAAEERWR